MAKLVLHFDVNETIILEDAAGGDSKEDCLNKIIAKAAHVSLNGTRVPTHYKDGSPLMEEGSSQSPDPSSSLDFTFNHAPTTSSYYRAHESFKRNSKRFTDHPHGRRFKPLLEELRSSLESPVPLPPALSKDGRSHFLLPSFLETLVQLSNLSRDYTLVLRTFGTDLHDIALALDAFCSGQHPLFPSYRNPHLKLDPSRHFLGRYDRATGEYALYSKVDGRRVTSTEIEVLSLLEGQHVSFIQDDYEYWSLNNCAPSFGKPLWLPPLFPSSPSCLHLIFDDNIHNDPQDSIVALRRPRIPTATDPSPFEVVPGPEIPTFEGLHLVKVHSVEACLRRTYFLDKINACLLRIATAQATAVVTRGKAALTAFYASHPEVDASHGELHARAVLEHAERAVESVRRDERYTWEPGMQEAILLAAMLHDVDDHKYFPKEASEPFPNAKAILASIGVQPHVASKALYMISLVSCSSNGNDVPSHLTSSLHYLIPRWSDRLEAVGRIGVVRCYQYNCESGRPLSGPNSPRATSVEEVWANAKPERFEQYRSRGGSSEDMISHYFDKLLHIARPPSEIVQNEYLERKAEDGAKELVEVCLRFGESGVVDVSYIRTLEDTMVGHGGV